MKKMLYKKRQSGQATTEMAFMLLGFAILLLGLIFTMSLEIFNTRTLLESKFETEQASTFANSSLHGGTGKEIGAWKYNDGIPFTLKDEPLYHTGNQMLWAHTFLGSTTDFNEGNRNYAYEWVKLQEFPNANFTADYKDRDQSTIAAANLITRKGDPKGRMLTAKLPELFHGLARLVGVRINYDNLRNNPSNRVFLPANGEL